jgi:hypothetical protein
MLNATVQPQLWPEEEWRPVPGYEGLYQVSSWGRVWSVPRRGIAGQKIRGGMLRPYTEPSGYQRVALSKDGAQRGFRVHELVAAAFLGPRPAGARVVRHLNGDPANNFASNLEFGDDVQNWADTVKHRLLYGGATRPYPQHAQPQPRTVQSLPGEVWRDVVGYEGLYRVSSLGRVMSLPRTTTRGGLLKQNVGTNGRLEVNLTRNGQQKVHRVHSLVAEAFLGPRPTGMEVRHLDGNATNNSAGNLAYGTHAENMDDMRRHGSSGHRRKTHCPKRHEYTPDNTVYNSKGGRACRECARIKSRDAARAKVLARGPRKRPCDHCGETFEVPLHASGPRRYCTDACREAAGKLRKQAS